MCAPKRSVTLQVAGANQKALDAFEKAAEANLRGRGTEWHAAKHLESAAQISKDMEQWPATADFARRASQLYIDAGKLGTGAECMGRAARWLETGSPATSGVHVKLPVALFWVLRSTLTLDAYSCTFEQAQPRCAQEEALMSGRRLQRCMCACVHAH